MVAPKISETILAFAKPLLDLLGRPPAAEELDDMLKLAVTAWNSVIFDDSARSTNYVSRARSLLMGRPESVGLFDQLVLRKRTVFAGDRRLIGEATVVKDKNGEARIRVQAHEPPPRRDRLPQNIN